MEGKSERLVRIKKRSSMLIACYGGDDLKVTRSTSKLTNASRGLSRVGRVTGTKKRKTTYRSGGSDKQERAVRKCTYSCGGV